MIRIKTTKVHLSSQEIKRILLKEMKEQGYIPQSTNEEDVEVGGPFLSSFELGATITYAEREEY